MKKNGVLAGGLIGALLLAGLMGAIAFGGSSDVTRLDIPGLPGAVSRPVRLPGGNLLVANTDIDSTRLFVVDAARKGTTLGSKLVPFEPGARIDEIQLAARDVPEGQVAALAVISYCPRGGFGTTLREMREDDCRLKQVIRTLELTAGGEVIGAPKLLPSGADVDSGFLYASDDTYVWSTRSPSTRSIFVSGQWKRIATTEASHLPYGGDCASRDYLWTIHSDAGPQGPSGIEAALPIENPDFELYRYRLDGRLHNEWEQIDLDGIELGNSQRIACGDHELFILGGGALYTTSSLPDPIATDVLAIKTNRARRPIVVFDDFRCAAVLPGGDLVFGGTVGSAEATEKSQCDAVPWPSDDGLEAVLVKGDELELTPW